VLDGVNARVLEYDGRCRYVGQIDYSKFAKSVVDVKYSDGLLLLGYDKSFRGKVFRVLSDGSPRNAFGIATRPNTVDLRSIHVGDDRAINVWRTDGIDRITNFARIERQDFIAESRFKLQIKNNELIINGKAIDLKLNKTLAEIGFIGRTRSGAVVYAEYVESNGYKYIYELGLDGAIKSSARLKKDNYIPVDNDCVVSKNIIYCAIASNDRFEVRRVDLGKGRVAIIDALMPEVSEWPVIERDKTEGDAKCSVMRRDIFAVANSYLNNTKTLTKTNIDGACQRRVKPRYLTMPGEYPSVSYKWGGSDLPSEFNDRTSKGAKAGHIVLDGADKVTLACATGTDCSGFVSRAFALPVKQGTSGLADISYSLAAAGNTKKLRPGDIMDSTGDHVVIFVSRNDDGSINTFESTQKSSYDRVVSTFRKSSALAKYKPMRYRNLCDFIDGKIGCAGGVAALFVNNMKFNFEGGQAKHSSRGLDYDGATELYLTTITDYARDKKSLKMTIKMYSDAAKTSHVRTDECVGTWDDSTDANRFTADCVLTENTNAGCPVIWVDYGIDEMGDITPEVGKLSVGGNSVGFKGSRTGAMGSPNPYR